MARCQPAGTPPIGGNYSHREMPSFLIFHCNVDAPHPQAGRGPLGPAHHPVGLAEGNEDVLMGSLSYSMARTAVLYSPGR